MPDSQQPHYLHTTDLLQTKLAPPQLAAPMLRRDTLLDRLDEGVSRRLTLISAPAGFGKTTLAAEWVARRAEPAAWVSLEPADSDPVRFWRYVVTACQVFDPKIGRAALPLLGGMQRAWTEPFLTALINALGALEGRRLLILDDYHSIASDDIHQALDFLLQHLPPTLHIALTVRADPPLSLGRLRARNDLSELRTDDLRFTRPEIQSFLETTFRTALAPDLIEHLEKRTEGWGAGLRLIALALEGRTGPDEIAQFLSTFGGGQKHLAEYLVGDVLSAQPEPIQAFILQTAALSRFTASLCDEVTLRDDSQDILARLEIENLFLVPLSGEGPDRWYRYHPLFAEAVAAEARRRLSEDSLREALDRASLWYEQYGFLNEAVEAALDGQNYENAARLIDHLVEARSFGEIHTLRRWIERVPDSILASHPDLAFSYAAALLYTLDRRAPTTAERVEGVLALAEPHWLREENQQKLGAVQAFRAGVAFWQSNLLQAVALARQALELLGDYPVEVYWRGMALLFVSMHNVFDGRIDDAGHAIMEIRAIFEAAQDLQGALAATHLHAEACYWRGQHHQSAELYQQILDKAVDKDDPSDRPYAFLGLGRIQYEWNEISVARQGAESAIETAREMGDDRLLTQATLLLARCEFAAGQAEQAQQRLNALVTSSQWPQYHREVRAWQACLYLRAGDIVSARRELESLAKEGPPTQRMQQELEDFMLARLEIAQGKTGDALPRLQKWRADALAEGRTRSEIESLILQALVYFTQRDESEARQALSEAFDLAQAGDHRRLFIDEGEPMVFLLKAILAERDEPSASYARILLHTFMESQLASSEASLTNALIEPLSAQERRVLRLLAAGLSNADIAEELVVSVNTIKTQLKSIYHKLSVRSREEARDAAHDLHLI